MRFAFLLLVTVLVFATTPLPDHWQDHQIAYYSFNQCDARDDSGEGSNGELHGNVRCWCGVEDDGLLLDGRNSYVTFHGPVNNYFTGSDFTISFYFKAETKLAFPQSLISKRADCSDSLFLDFQLNTVLSQLDVDLQERERRFFYDLYAELEPATWRHVALVRDGFYARLFLNGKLVSESRRCGGLNIANEAPLSFSNSPCVRSGKQRRFKGVLDELRIFDRALTEEELLQLYELHPVENAQMDCVS